MPNNESNCIFCKIISKEIPAFIIYEDEATIAFLDIAPVSKGHTLVVPKNHAQDLSTSSQADAVAVMKTIYKIAPIITKTLGATGYNLGMNHGKDAGQEVAHTHFHIMPRYAGQSRSFNRLHPAKHEMNEVADQLKKAMGAL